MPKNERQVCAMRACYAACIFIIICISKMKLARSAHTHLNAVEFTIVNGTMAHYANHGDNSFDGIESVFVSHCATNHFKTLVFIRCDAILMCVFFMKKSFEL